MEPFIHETMLLTTATYGFFLVYVVYGLIGFTLIGEKNDKKVQNQGFIVLAIEFVFALFLGFLMIKGVI